MVTSSSPTIQTGPHSSAMAYRRFGRTELAMPVWSCGGMRCQQGWTDLPADEITAESQANVEACLHRALELGINHIETARGYGSSERQMGHVFRHLSREAMIVQTKVVPGNDAADFLETFETSMARLQLDFVDLLAIHGINNRDLLDRVLAPDGALTAVRRLQRDGRVRFVGFSTHGALDMIIDAINTGEFDYVNLHYYYMDQLNAPAIAAARAHDMGVFIISPSDKGGRLYAPPKKLVAVCKPFSPMGFNDLFCLSEPGVHTVSLGAARPSDFDVHVDMLPYIDAGRSAIESVIQHLESAKQNALGQEWTENWSRGLPDVEAVSGQVALYHILRLYNCWKAFDMLDYARMRYNLLGNGSHWFPGSKVDAVDWEALPESLKDSPVADQIPAALRAAHAAFDGDEVKRLSQRD